MFPNRELYKEFEDLRGHKWATSDSESLSANKAMLSEVRKIGSNATFFGHIIHAGKLSDRDLINYFFVEKKYSFSEIMCMFHELTTF